MQTPTFVYFALCTCMCICTRNYTVHTQFKCIQLYMYMTKSSEWMVLHKKDVMKQNRAEQK